MCNMKYDHPILAKTLELHSELTRDGKETVFVWVSGHVGIRANLAADSVAKVGKCVSPWYNHNG